ncbi:MAG TPA: hypothetical protein VJ746_19295 [Nitrospira sp.]|nr:hypothetical protein [Nitrospira sp.]
MITHFFDQHRARIEQVIRKPGLRKNSVRVSAAPKDEGERRREPRVEQWQPCSYEASESSGEMLPVTQTGEAVALDRSQEGILLLMEQAPTPTKLLEVHTSQSLGRKTLLVFDVRWVKPVQVPSVGRYYLVGCRRTFGPYHYVQF